MLKVDNKYDVGQEVYVIRETIKTIQHTEKCDTCEGMGIIVYKGKNCNVRFVTMEKLQPAQKEFQHTLLGIMERSQAFVSNMQMKILIQYGIR